MQSKPFGGSKANDDPFAELIEGDSNQKSGSIGNTGGFGTTMGNSQFGSSNG